MLFRSTGPFNRAFQPGLSTGRFNRAFQPGVSTWPFNRAFQPCVSKKYRLFSRRVLPQAAAIRGSPPLNGNPRGPRSFCNRFARCPRAKRRVVGNYFSSMVLTTSIFCIMYVAREMIVRSSAIHMTMSVTRLSLGIFMIMRMIMIIWKVVFHLPQ